MDSQLGNRSRDKREEPEDQGENSGSCQYAMAGELCLEKE